MSDVAAGGPILKHSYLKPRKYPSCSALRPQPLSELHPSVQSELQHILDVDLAAFAEPFKGVTADGVIRPGLFSIKKTGVTLQPMLDKAVAFLKTLAPEQRKAVTFPVDAVEWRMWHNAHPFLFRHGVCLHDMTEMQRQAALALVREGLSASAYQTARDIMRLNYYCYELTGRVEEYGEYYYFMSIFGEPSASEPWGWQLDGHHMAFNCFVLGDEMILTPNFMGSEPTYAESGKYAGTRVFESEESQGYDLMHALSPDQQAKALISRQIPRQLITVVPWDNKILSSAASTMMSLSPRKRN